MNSYEDPALSYECDRTRGRGAEVMSGWNGPDWMPPHSGWYKVRRDGVEKVRAYGNGHWWIPLPDGWLSADGVYEWQQPRIAPLDDGDGSPLAECERVTSTVSEVQK